MSTQLDDPAFLASSFACDLPQIYRSALKNLKKILLPSLLLHLIFPTLILSEILLFFFVSKKLVVTALLLGGIFATLFTYLISFFYTQTKRVTQLIQLKEEFLKSCREHLLSEPHLALAEAASRLAIYLEGFESRLYPVHFLNSLAKWFHREDLFRIKKLLLQAAVEEHLKQVRLTPTNLEVHASCARIYTLLSRLYRKVGGTAEEKANAAEALAIQELQILNEYAPNDPWVYEQLEKGYARLGMQEEQLTALESLATLRPQDSNILFRLGILYFHAGFNAKGLQTYQLLKQLNFKKAEELIQRYGQPYR
ncbi:MAG TPA: hypothetical protein VJK48_01340 [Chlamydiales bacterium]|nr:hypothetical protein [Chlamydiales bacterium]